MKKLFLILPVLLAGVLIMMNVSCADTTPEEVCESFDVNEVKPSCQAPDLANACCEGDNCYYTYNGVNYECEGEDCTEAQLELLAIMCPTASREDIKEMQLSLQNHTLFLLNQTRKHSLLNK